MLVPAAAVLGVIAAARLKQSSAAKFAQLGANRGD
jgi:hypothetical protein